MAISINRFLLNTVSAMALGAVVAGGAMVAPTLFGASPAFAQDDGEGGENGANGNAGGQGQGDQGAQSGQGNQGGQDQGQGGPGDDSDGVGPQSGGPSDDGSGGGRPAWASEGIPEVELGRLSVARSPDHVLDQAYDEALLAIGDMADFYNLSLDDMITELSLNWDEITLIDSPLQNLAIFRDALDGGIDLSAYGITNDTFTILAVTLGVASDKTLPITADTVYALSVIFDMPMSEADSFALAAAAEAIRIAVLAGHG